MNVCNVYVLPIHIQVQRLQTFCTFVKFVLFCLLSVFSPYLDLGV